MQIRDKLASIKHSSGLTELPTSIKLLVARSCLDPVPAENARAT
jgi:hypothetical protein